MDELVEERTKRKDYSGAILDFSQAMAQGWTDAMLFKLRAEALYMAGKFEAAFHEAHMAVASDGSVRASPGILA